ncbi:hypothetical protein SAMD00019534_070120 [Acytostelium subglobosum LB1]|uniref:hypothetical protein n=1 Tax=Acytostelium subglobosum LB1 TaxID=1410327 RepID=UPI000644E5F6|nr:hypothetical protein SAMD00019534_070120 [Acytostelium subglobosum LB1]GAM23837.1 hypothetical protein SAMD00019534_070120 [Acytostelium subglobosum LB1]|eukprot:XP_012752873.1 hypothetical protein SAMD00019534_070120 [Acytostelium subglobosum LB1]
MTLGKSHNNNNNNQNGKYSNQQHVVVSKPLFECGCHAIVVEHSQRIAMLEDALLKMQDELKSLKELSKTQTSFQYFKSAASSIFSSSTSNNNPSSLKSSTTTMTSTSTTTLTELVAPHPPRPKKRLVNVYLIDGDPIDSNMMETTREYLSTSLNNLVNSTDSSDSMSNMLGDQVGGDGTHQPMLKVRVINTKEAASSGYNDFAPEERQGVCLFMVKVDTRIELERYRATLQHLRTKEYPNGKILFMVLVYGELQPVPSINLKGTTCIDGLIGFSYYPGEILNTDLSKTSLTSIHRHLISTVSNT